MGPDGVNTARAGAAVVWAGSVRHVSRRSKMPLLAVPLVLALSAVTAGCATFTDKDNVARVGDVELSRADFETQLTDLGAPTDEPLEGEPVRGVITTWIQEQLAGLPVDADALRGTYEQGAATSGVLCVSAIVVADQATAEAVADDITGGTPFADAFAASNIDDQIAATGGALPCAPSDDEANAGVPFLVAAADLTPDDDVATAPLLDQVGQEVAWVVVRFRPFDELGDDDVAAMNATQAAADIDIHVDPRYGTYDRVNAQVVALG